MVFSFFKPTKQSPVTLLIDVGSASVGAALVEKVPGGTPRIFATVRQSIPFQVERSSQKLLRALGHTLEHVLHTVKADLKGKTVTEVNCTFSSPWCLVRSRHIEYSSPRGVTFTKELQDHLIAEDDLQLRGELKDALPAEDILIIERKILNITLNGYVVKNPYGKKVSSVNMDVVVSVSSKKLALDIESRIRRIFPVGKFTAGSFSVSAFNGVRDMVPHVNNFLIIDVTGEGTDCSLVVNDTLVQHNTFAKGKNSLIRDVSLKLAIPHEAAVTLLNMFFHDMLEGKKRALVEQVLSQAKEEWGARLKKTLDTFTRQGSLPRVVFLSSDTDVFELFQSIIQGGAPDRGTQLSVESVDSKLVGPFVRYDSGVIKDPFLAIEALLINKI